MKYLLLTLMFIVLSCVTLLGNCSKKSLVFLNGVVLIWVTIWRASCNVNPGTIAINTSGGAKFTFTAVPDSGSTHTKGCSFLMVLASKPLTQVNSPMSESGRLAQR